MAITQEYPLVTVGIPTYNRAEGLDRTLRSITSQTYRNLEILVSDNCSPNSAVMETALRYANADPRIKYHRQITNIGAVANFFALAELAQGEYFMWAADDDWWDDNFVMESLELLQSHPTASVAVTRFEPIIVETRTPFYLPKAYEMICKIKNEDTFKRLLNYINQREALGKAHIIYGLIPRKLLCSSIVQAKNIVSASTSLAEFQRIDFLLNAIILTHGNIVTSDLCLRKYSSGARDSVGGIKMKKRKWFDPHFLNYINFLKIVINNLDLDSRKIEILLSAIKKKKRIYILERVGRKLLIFKVYWSLYKKLFFQKYS